MAANYRLVFTHIGKTGGSSVAAVLDRIINACDLNMLTVSGASSVLATADLSERALHAENLRLGDFQIIKGHVPFATARKYFMPARFVTVLRDPRWQLISNYCSQPSNMRKAGFRHVGLHREVSGPTPMRNGPWTTSIPACCAITSISGAPRPKPCFARPRRTCCATIS